MVWSLRRVVVFLIDLTTGIIGVVLGLSIILKLVGANSATPFVSWIYSWSAGLTYPFAGILPNLNLGNGAVLDIVGAVSLVAYSVIAYFATRLMDVLITNLPTEYTRHEEHIHV